MAKTHQLVVKELPIAFVNRADGKTKLKDKDIVNWAFFTGKSMFSFRPSFTRPVQVNSAICKSPALRVTLTAPSVSTTK